MVLCSLRDCLLASKRCAHQGMDAEVRCVSAYLQSHLVHLSVSVSYFEVACPLLLLLDSITGTLVHGAFFSNCQAMLRHLLDHGKSNVPKQLMFHNVQICSMPADGHSTHPHSTSTKSQRIAQVQRRHSARHQSTTKVACP